MKNMFILLILIGTIFAQVVSQGTYSAIVNTSVALCTDSDNGLNPDVAGHVTLGGQTYNDSCFSQGTVREYYCVNNIVSSTDIACPVGKSCVSGACIYTFGMPQTLVGNQTNTTNPALSGSSNNTTYIAPVEPIFYTNQSQTAQSTGLLSGNNFLICGGSVLVLLVVAGAYMMTRR